MGDLVIQITHHRAGLSFLFMLSGKQDLVREALKAAASHNVKHGDAVIIQLPYPWLAVHFIQMHGTFVCSRYAVNSK